MSESFEDVRGACGIPAVTRYHKRILGSLVDRIDIDVAQVWYENFPIPAPPGPGPHPGPGGGSPHTANQCVRGTAALTSPDMGAREVQSHCQLDAASDTLMRAAMRQLQLSARTIADLAASDAIQSHHLAEALQYRPKVTM